MTDLGRTSGGKVIVALDGSEHAWKALDLAAELAKLHSSELIVLHVVAERALPEQLRVLAAAEHIPIEEEAARVLADQALGDALTREGERRARECQVEHVSSRVAQGDPADEIVRLAVDERADLLVLGSRGLGDVRSLLLGSVSHKVAHLAPCTCVLVK